MAITEPGISPPDASPSAVGRHLRAVRKSKGLSRAEVARSAGLTRRELAAYERGRSPVPDSDLWCLAGSCGVDVGDLLPSRDRLGVGSDLGALTVGESVRRLRPGTDADGVLREYLAMLYELRNLPPGTKPPMREADLATLADALGGTPEAIEARLHDLIGASREEAARLRSMILPPRPIAAHAADPLPALSAFGPGTQAASLGVPVAAGATALPAMGMPTAMPSYPPPTFDFATAPPAIGDPDATDRFFGAPRAEDPFGAPMSLEALTPPSAEFGPSAFDTFAPPTAPAISSFGPPTGPPLATFPTAAEPVPPDGFLADLGTDLPDASVPALGATGTGPEAFSPPPADAFGAMEMVVLDIGPDGNVLDGYGPMVAEDPDLASPDSGTAPWELASHPEEDDDPFAVLRMPIDETDPAGAVPSGADAEWPDVADATSDTLAQSLTDGSAEDPDAFFDAFADAYEATDAAADAPAADWDAVELDDEVAPDEEPGDDWFDRAAAAADALIAEQRQDEPLAAFSLAGTNAVAEPEPDVAFAAAAAEALPPIAWSLAPPDDAPVNAAALAPTGEQFVAAGTDWQVGGIFPATAMADDGTLALRRADVRWALADIAAAGDFTVRAAVSFTGGAGFGILFRVSTDGAERITGYSFDVDPVYSGGGFLVRQWNDSRQHWKPLAHSPVADTARLYGAHVIEVSLRSDTLVARIDGEVVMTIEHLSRASIDAGHEPCRGGRLGVQAWSTTEVTVDRLLVAHH